MAADATTVSIDTPAVSTSRASPPRVAAPPPHEEVVDVNLQKKKEKEEEQEHETKKEEEEEDNDLDLEEVSEDLACSVSDEDYEDEGFASEDSQTSDAPSGVSLSDHSGPIEAFNVDVITEL